MGRMIILILVTLSIAAECGGLERVYYVETAQRVGDIEGARTPQRGRFISFLSDRSHVVISTTAIKIPAATQAIPSHSSGVRPAINMALCLF